MLKSDQVLQNIERAGRFFNWSGWQIRFVQAGATLLGRDFPGLGDPNVTDEQLIDLANRLSQELLEVSEVEGERLTFAQPLDASGNSTLQSQLPS